MGLPDMTIPKDWEEITDVLTPEGIEKVISRKTVLKFKDAAGKLTVLKVMRKRNGRVWAKKITTYKADDVSKHWGHEVDKTKSPPFCKTCNVEVAHQS